MLVFVTVNADNYLGRGREYVEVLFDSIRRNLRAGTEGKFVCFTNDEDPYSEGIEKRPLHGELEGWFNKLYLFKDGHFNDGDRIVYMDLDTVIVSGLDEIAAYNGQFAILRDFYRPNGLQSSFMMWMANHFPHIWDWWEQNGRLQPPGGDQEVIQHYLAAGFVYNILQDYFPTCFVSYKVHCLHGTPINAKVVIFHGSPRPHEVGGWVKNIWKVGGGSTLELEMIPNVSPEKLEANIRGSLALGLPYIEGLTKGVPNEHAILVGGGPSLKDFASEIRIRQAHGEKVFALNGAYKWLTDNKITADYHIIADARPENADFITANPATTYLIASHCDKAVFEKIPHDQIIIWHRGHDGIQDIVDADRTKHVAYMAGGSTVGMIGMSIAYSLGYRKLHLFGYDSSYFSGDGHAYPQALNDSDRVLDIQAFNRDFFAAPWMAQQVNEFMQLAPALINLGCEISTHGDGLLQYVASVMSAEPTPETQIIEIDGMFWPAGDFECRASIEAHGEDVDAITSYCKKFDVAVQAGGNVGAWPKRLAAKFKSVYTFEPDNANFQCLARNVPELNVIKIQGILGSEAGLISLETTRHNCGAHFVNGLGIIPTFRIDDLGLNQCDLIQLDVEGFELSALKGALKTIERFKPVIVCEEKGLGEKFGVDEDAIGNLLSAFGYEVRSLLSRDVVYTINGE